jgi:single-stranded DNA-specific DHH superfamily exonuclease
MLTKKQVLDIKEHLNNAQNPLFLFDNDQDGLCSFILLRKFIGRGKGFPIKGNDLSKEYFRKVQEFDSDYIFVLDKPRISQEFFDEVKKFNIPLVWIDHHEQNMVVPDFVYYYNPLYNKKKSNEPVTALCYQISKRKEDLWLGVVGSIADNFIPRFYNSFKKEYPELSLSSDKAGAFDIFYASEIGRIARIFGFGIKDKVTNVINMTKLIINSKGPYDILQENKENKLMHKRFFDIEKKYSAIMNKAKKKVDDSNVLFFEYSGDMSISSEIANGLKYLFPNKIVIVAYTKGAKINVSARGLKIRDKIVKIISELDNATGGGHENAVGAQIDKDDLEKFKKKVKDYFN